ncbi:hypothetical protein FIBSPDRAFT_989666, partial [Athelia psychrophila]
VINLQASSILNEAYCERLRGQLAFREEKKATGKLKGKLMGDGLPVLLTGDVFFEKVVDAEAARKQDERGKKQRQLLRQDRTEALTAWKQQNDARTKAIEKRKAEWTQEKIEWEAERAAAKVAKEKFTKKQPICGKLPPAIPRPPVIPVELDNDDNDDNDDRSEA